MVDAAGRLGQRLRARRAELGLTLLAVAIDAGLSVPYIANLEKGRGNPTLDVIVALASALGVAPAELLDHDGAGDAIDELFADLPPVLADFAHAKTLRPATQRVADHLGMSVEGARLILLRAMVAAPRPPGRSLSQHDCRRLLDAYLSILTDPGDH
jgi:transcriptional regulator with XRE-family HTH domain